MVGFHSYDKYARGEPKVGTTGRCWFLCLAGLFLLSSKTHIFRISAMLLYVTLYIYLKYLQSSKEELTWTHMNSHHLPPKKKHPKTMKNPNHFPTFPGLPRPPTGPWLTSLPRASCPPLLSVSSLQGPSPPLKPCVTTVMSTLDS